MSLILVDFSQCFCYSLAFSDPSLSLASFLVVDHHFLLCGVRLTVDKRDSHFSTCSLCLSRLSAPGSWESRFLTLLFFSPHPEAANLGLVSMVGLWDPVMSGFQPFLQRWLGYASIPPSQAVCLYLQSGWKVSSPVTEGFCFLWEDEQEFVWVSQWQVITSCKCVPPSVTVPGLLPCPSISCAYPVEAHG